MKTDTRTANVSQSKPSSDPLLNLFEADTTLESAEPILALVARYLSATRDTSGPVSTKRTARDVADALAGPMPRHGRSLASVAERLQTLLLDDVNRLMHPMAMGHQVSAPLPATIWTEALIAAVNNSQAVREMSPTFTPLERQVIRWCTDLIGWDARAGGTMTSGGTEATFSALLAARSAVIPDVWTNGVGTNPPVLVCGEHTHYAVTRAAGEMGLGMSRVVVIPSLHHAMDTDVLRARLSALRDAGTRVMAVVATAGCTATGSFDDLHRIADICDAVSNEPLIDASNDSVTTPEPQGLWLHVDAAHGGAAMLSAVHRHRVSGLSRARSVAWDPHKMLLLPLAAGLVLMRDERDLGAAYAQSAPYLFTGTNDARSWDTGQRSFQCSRRSDIVKLWVAFERYGADHLAAFYDRLCGAAQTLYDVLAARSDFVPLHEPQANILCFAWTPAGVADDERDALTDALRERYNRSGHGWLTVTTLDGRRVLRVTVMNVRTTPAHVRRLVDGLAAEGVSLLAERVARG